MKTCLKWLLFYGWFFLAGIQSFAQGYIVPNGVSYAGSFLLGTGYGINVVHNPTNFESTGFAFTPLGKTPPGILFTNTFRFDSIVDVGVRCFMVSANTSINVQPILDQTWTELEFNQYGYVFPSGVPFYLALYTGNQNNYPPDGIYSDPLFGWVELVNNRGVIQMLDGALEYGGAGIIAGTQTVIQVVPEPGGMVLFAFGLIGLVWNFPRRCRQI